MGAILNVTCPCMRNDDAQDAETAMVSRYQGERNCLGQKHGYGVYLFHNGDKYEGCWKFNKMHGCGVYTHDSGVKKDGFFRNGVFIGSAIPQPTTAQGDYVAPQPAPQNNVQQVRDEAARNQRRLERERERQSKKAERQKRLEEWHKKYPPRGKRYGAIAGE